MGLGTLPEGSTVVSKCKPRSATLTSHCFFLQAKRTTIGSNIFWRSIMGSNIFWRIKSISPSSPSTRYSRSIKWRHSSKNRNATPESIWTNCEMLLQKAFQPIMKKTCDTWIESACISVLSLANPNSSITRRGRRVGVKGVVACVTKHVPIPKIMCHVSMTGSSSYSGRFGRYLAGLGRVGHSSPPPLLYFSPSYGGCILPP